MNHHNNQVDMKKELQNELFTQNIKNMHPQSREMLIAEIAAMEKSPNLNEKVLPYLKWVLKETEINFYLAILPQGRGLVLLKQNLKAVLIIGLNRPHQEIQSYFPEHEFVLEILNIHSLQKGEGYKIMQKVLGLAQKIETPICLWTDNQENVQYFERYGFKNHGPQPGSNDNLLIYHM